MQTIHYTKGQYKYQLVGDAVQIKTDIREDRDIHTEFISLTRSGMLTVYSGYCWDGPSGPTIDTKSFMRGSLFHDALYQMMRREFIGRDWKKTADRLLQKVCIADGMWKLRAWWVYQGVKLGGKGSAHPDNQRKIYTAP